MIALPSHASRDICQRERERLQVARREPGVHYPDLNGLVCWLLDECDHLEREYESMAADARHWRAKALDAEKLRHMP